MKLSIVIISWNSLPMLRRCLESLRPVVSRQDVELIWVDNGSTDGSEEWVEREFPEVNSIILDRNYGVAYARNRGVEQAKGEYLLFLDDDTESTPESIDAMMRHLDTHPETGMCGVALRDGDGNLQDSFKEFPGIGVKVRNVLRSHLRVRKEVELPTGVIEADYIIGACQMIRRHLFASVGLLDERIFYGPEDADFCIRVHKAGWKVCYLPDWSITHHWRRSTSVNPLNRLGRKHTWALWYFYRKHHRYF